MKKNSKKYLLRSMLFVPTYKKKFLDKALQTDADALILDLEDSVPNIFKQEARLNVREYLEQGRFKGVQVFVRLNSIESELLLEDLKYVLHNDIDGFMLSKIYTQDDMIYYDKLITQLESENNSAEGHFKFIPLIETTSAVMDVYNIAKVSKRTIALAFGGEDFLNDLEGLHGDPPRAFDYPRAAIAIAARAAGIEPIDTPYLAIRDYEGFVKEETISFELGYAGCLVIHPEQIELANICFTPRAEEVELSKQIIKCIEESKEMGSGVAMLGNKMIGPPMEKRARKVIDKMELIRNKSKLYK